MFFTGIVLLKVANQKKLTGLFLSTEKLSFFFALFIRPGAAKAAGLFAVIEIRIAAGAGAGKLPVFFNEDFNCDSGYTKSKEQYG